MPLLSERGPIKYLNTKVIRFKRWFRHEKYGVRSRTKSHGKTIYIKSSKVFSSYLWKVTASAEKHGVAHIFLQLGKLRDRWNSSRGQPTMARRRLRAVLKLHELSHLRGCQMCITNGGNCKGKNKNKFDNILSLEKIIINLVQIKGSKLQVI